MKFLVITNAPTLFQNNKQKAYAPYVNEMDLWFKYAEKVRIVSPTKYDKPLLIKEFQRQDIEVISIPGLDFTNAKSAIKSLFGIPVIIWMIFKNLFWAEHIHLRCPGNIGLFTSVLQVLFPSKPKTVKYAGNWDPESNQPLSYRIQKKILSSTILTKKVKVLVYGEWENQTKNIVPFFTASYHESDMEEVASKNLTENINLIFVGALAPGKRPDLSLEVCHELYKKGISVQLNIFGDGALRTQLESYVKEHSLENIVKLHGNVPKETVKEAFKNSHFLIFISKSEGWPKVVAESMFWKCLPLSSKVSCVPSMIGHGTRGSIVKPNVDDVVKEVEYYLDNESIYLQKTEEACQWSRQYTLEKFDLEIKKLLDA